MPTWLDGEAVRKPGVAPEFTMQALQTGVSRGCLSRFCYGFFERHPPCKRIHAGANPVGGPAVETSRWCNGTHRILLRFWPCFDSRSGR